MDERITERDLVLPALWCMSRKVDQYISTTELMKCLREVMQPTGEDLDILTGRNDDKFSQKVRNLRSHKTLEKLRFAEYKSRGSNGFWRITEAGRRFLGDYGPLLQYCIDGGFDYKEVNEALRKVDYNSDQQKRRRLEFLDENVIVREGARVRTEGEIATRSAKLREAAIQHYSASGTIACSACGFDFGEFYGEIGRGFIEIHHTKPIVAYEDEDVEMTIKKALGNVRPLCSNCHRMVHRRRGSLLSIEELRRLAPNIHQAAARLIEEEPHERP